VGQMTDKPRSYLLTAGRFGCSESRNVSKWLPIQKIASGTHVRQGSRKSAETLGPGRPTITQFHGRRSTTVSAPHIKRLSSRDFRQTDARCTGGFGDKFSNVSAPFVERFLASARKSWRWYTAATPEIVPDYTG